MPETLQRRRTVVITGKLPPPYMGPAIATQVLLNSDLKNRFRLVHFNNTINKTIDTQGKAGIGKVFSSMMLYVSFFRLLRQEKPDLVLIPISQTTVGFLKDAPYVLISKWIADHTLIQLRGSNLQTWLKESFGFTRWIFKATVRGTDGVIVLGDKLRYLFQDYFDPDQIFVAPNGGDYTFPLRSSADDRLSVLYFANLYESKGVRVLLDAALKFEDADVNFVFTGGWRDDKQFREAFMADVRSSKLDIQVNEPTSGEAKFAMFANADLFVFPPIMPEGHPWVLVEAMAAGLPIIATDQGAITESVIDGVNGFIVPAGDSNAIVAKIQFFKSYPQERKKMAEASKRLYRERFSEEQLADNYTSIFNSVIEKR